MPKENTQIFSPKEAVQALEKMINRELSDVQALKARYENGEDEKDDMVYVYVSGTDYRNLKRKAFPSIGSKILEYSATAIRTLAFGELFDLKGTNVFVINKGSRGLINKGLNGILGPNDIRYWACYENFRK